MDPAKRKPGRAFCPQCGQKYAVPDQELKRHPGLRFRATCRTCATPFSVRWQDGGMITEAEEPDQAEGVGTGRNVLAKGARVGKYEVEAMIASGGSASVYRAFEMGANRTVALKVLHQAADSDYGVRFRREVEVQGNLKHPNLMPIFDQGSIDGRPYYSMELLHKPTTLETIVSLFRGRRLAYNPALRTLDSLESLLRRVLLPVARAVDFANKHGVIHRDLKPGNVILDARTLHVYIIDFGICHVSKQTGQRLVLRGREDAPVEPQTAERARLTMGTIRFMPPEQARGEISGQGDVWALGALLYYILSGDGPIAPAIDLTRVSVDKRVANLRKIAASSRKAGDDEEAAIYEARVQELEAGTARTSRDVLHDAQGAAYRPLADGTDPALAAIALRAMAPDPKDRYPDGARFSEDIQRFLEGRPVRALVQNLGPGRAALYKARLQFDRNKRPMLAGAIAILLGACVMVILALKDASNREEQIQTWLREAREAADPAVQEDRLTRVLAMEPEHEVAEDLLALARKYLPLRAKLKAARDTRKRVDELRKARRFDEAEELAEDTAAVLEGSVLPDLRSLPESYRGRADETEAKSLADFLRGRRLIGVHGVPNAARVHLIPPRARRRLELAWDKPEDWGQAPLTVTTRALDPGAYVMVITLGEKALYLPFRVSHHTPARAAVEVPMSPAELPAGMVYVGRDRMEYGDLRFTQSTQRVTVEPFLIDALEVSNRDYAVYVNALEPAMRVLAVPRRLLPGPGDLTEPLWTESADGSWSPPAGAEQFPVTSISYLDAAGYAQWAGKRLPTPQEWESAARGLDDRDYPFGDELVPDACNAHTGSVAEITAYPKDRSPCGVFQMAGNVAEWTDDVAGGEGAVIKGGSFDLPRYRAIISSFGRRRADLPHTDVGFRCAKDLPKR